MFAKLYHISAVVSNLDKVVTEPFGLPVFTPDSVGAVCNRTGIHQNQASSISKDLQDGARLSPLARFPNLAEYTSIVKSTINALTDMCACCLRKGQHRHRYREPQRTQ